ncbi:carbamoyl-phosphate synthase large subunit [Haliovirga abyssi]|uniref:Carbamoyl phosphate synthase large chain n=1 Tax=Haliovirga abyssi TaxID=2996794 RepID=A0AAU9DNX5_9FUSO|nr:carbamoyl-phosphate synthase large subunit [Haliovirga abyssi]BDU50083.1 carbamoyl phosphate synthase large subunit [Haliovirga abyssi]
MAKRTDIKKILVIGAGPIVIGQACEFDYSGTQACKALKEEGYEIVLINSNPATIMTDPEMADATYIEPIRADIIEKIIAKERPDAILPTIGGQTALNMAVELAEKGILEKYNVELIGAKLETINKAEDRELFKEAMEKLGYKMPKSGFANNLDMAHKLLEMVGFPAIIRPSFTLGGTGGGIAYNIDEFNEIVLDGIDSSPINQVLIDQSILGWKEYELEMMRDKNDNVVVICSIENIDPMGVHTGDSITVAPAQTLTDKEYQNLRNMSIEILREIGVDTGGCNVQFSVNPENGEVMIVEMNPRVSRSSALASKATGFPIAKIAAKLAVGYTLDEIKNDITKETYAAFEPTIDYVVTKIPRWAFEKFKGANEILTTKMKSVGEVMAIGRTFKESLQKALRGLEIGRFGLGADGKDVIPTESELVENLVVPNKDRIFYLRYGFKFFNKTVEDLYNLTKIDRWYLYQIRDIVRLEEEIEKFDLDNMSVELMRKAKEYGFSDVQLAYLLETDEDKVRAKRKDMKIDVTYKMVDTCAAEFKAYTPYLYSSYESECEANPTKNKKIMILGGGPNRIGQGIEFDYCCCHASFALQEDGYETIMVNSNPETVSTDYDTSDRLYFEPLTKEDVLNIIETEKPDGIIVQFGGQTPLNLSGKINDISGVKIIGTSPDSIDMAEDRDRFGEMLNKLGVLQPKNGIAKSVREAENVAGIIGFPIIVRPSYVLGGRAMQVVYDMSSLRHYMETAVSVSPEHPVLIDSFLEGAIEVDVDALCDGDDVVIGGIMEHIEEAGIHSGDSACMLPTQNLTENVLDTIKDYTKKMALELNVVGLMNVQYAVKDEKVYVLEVNPRASRTVPFVSKATGRPLAKIASRLMVGKKLKELGITEEIIPKHVAVKEAVFPFVKFPEVDPKLGPEMRSTGEVMGIDLSVGRSFYKAQYAINENFPLSGSVYVSVADEDKAGILEVVKQFSALNFKIYASRGTARYLIENGINKLEVINKLKEGRPNIVDYIKNNKINLIINTTKGKNARGDGEIIRKNAVTNGIFYATTIAGAKETIDAIKEKVEKGINVFSLQEYYKR